MLLTGWNCVHMTESSRSVHDRVITQMYKSNHTGRAMHNLSANCLLLVQKYLIWGSVEE